LEVMMLAAAKDAHNKATGAQQKLTSNLAGGMNLPNIPGLF
jgi:DNA-binding protein YbaB